MEKIKSHFTQLQKIPNHKTAKKIFYIIFAILIFISGTYFGSSHFSQAKNPGAAKHPPTQVLALKLYAQNIDDFEELPGRTSAYRYAEIRPQVDGIILKRLFTEGSVVKKGTQLYQIDDAPYKANYNSAKADLQKAQANLETIKAKNARFKKLIEEDAISKQEYDDIKATLAQATADVAIAKATMEKAKIYLNYTKVLAPIDGRISKSLTTEGALVSANQTQNLTTITQLDPIYVDIERASEDLVNFKNKISTQDKVSVELYLNDGTIYNQTGTLQFSEVNVDPSTSAVGLRAIFDNPDQTLLPGSFVKARIKISSENVVLVPQKATSRGPDGSLNVWIIDSSNTTKPVPIKTIKAIGNNWLVSEGVKDGDVIVLEGFQKIMPGAVVSPSFGEVKK